MAAKWTWLTQDRTRLRRVAVFVLCVGITLLVLQWNPIAQAAGTLRAGLQIAGSTIGQFYHRTFTTKDDLRAQRDHFQELAGNLAVEQSYIDRLERDVAELQTLLTYSVQLSYTSIPSRVLARSVGTGHQILLDRGSRDGVREQMAVTVADGHMIGYTSSVAAHTSVVTLLKNVQSKVPVAILGETRTIGLAEGQDGFLLHMNFIPQSEHIEVGDVVVTSGLDGNLPSGLVIGVIHEVIRDETANFQEALIEPIYEADAFSNVLILDPLAELYAP